MGFPNCRGNFFSYSNRTWRRSLVRNMVKIAKSIAKIAKFSCRKWLPVQISLGLLVCLFSVVSNPVRAEEIRCQAKKSVFVSASEIRDVDSEITATLIIDPEKGFKDDELAPEFVGECRVLPTGIECENSVNLSTEDANLRNSLHTHLTVLDDSLDLIMVFKGFLPEAFSLVSIGSCEIN